MTNVWLVTGDCSDYYCDGMHPLGIFETRAEAEAYASQMNKREITRVGEWKHGEAGDTIDYGPWSLGQVIEMRLGEVRMNIPPD